MKRTCDYCGTSSDDQDCAYMVVKDDNAICERCIYKLYKIVRAARMGRQDGDRNEIKDVGK